MKTLCEQQFKNSEDLSNYINEHNIKRKNIQSILYRDDKYDLPIILTFWSKQKKEKKQKTYNTFKEIRNHPFRYLYSDNFVY